MAPLSYMQQKRIDFFLSFLNKRAGKFRILDIGCQNGILCSLLKQKGHEPYGIEILPDLIDRCTRDHPGIVFQTADCEKQLPFENKSFDIVWAGDVIEHIRFTDIFVNEINRVLKIGGLSVVTTPLHNRVKNIYFALMKFEHHFNPEFPHLRFYSKKSLTSVFRHRGFEIESLSTIGRFPIIANTLFMSAKKVEDKSVMSEHRY